PLPVAALETVEVDALDPPVAALEIVLDAPPTPAPTDPPAPVGPVTVVEVFDAEPPAPALPVEPVDPPAPARPPALVVLVPPDPPVPLAPAEPPVPVVWTGAVQPRMVHAAATSKLASAADAWSNIACLDAPNCLR